MDVTKAFSQLRIMILDDCAGMRAVLRSILTGFGCSDLATHSSVDSALDALPSQVPDIIICDYQLDGLDGVDFVRLLREMDNEGLAMTPVIMVTAYTQRNLVRAYIGAGADEVVAKPVRPDVLYSRIAAVVNRRRQFVRTKNYFGPDRRRTDLPFEGSERRSEAVAKQAGG